jgi:hypothetical protein
MSPARNIELRSEPARALPAGFFAPEERRPTWQTT